MKEAHPLHFYPPVEGRGSAPQPPNNGGTHGPHSEGLTNQSRSAYPRRERFMDEQGQEQAAQPARTTHVAPQQETGSVGRAVEAPRVTPGEVADRLARVAEQAQLEAPELRLPELDLSKPEDRERLDRALRDFVPNQGSSSTPWLVRQTLKDTSGVKLDYLVNKILAPVLDAETSHYQLGFYAGINIETIRDELLIEAHRALQQGNKREAEIRSAQFTRVGRLRESVSLGHNMNRQVIVGVVDQLLQVAQEITPETLDTLQKERGVGRTMRLFDQELQWVVGRDSKITVGNYEELTGLRLEAFDEPKVQEIGGKNEFITGRVVGTKEGKLETQLTHLNNSIGTETQRLEDWQLRWAYIQGRNLLNITLRNAENISSSKVTTIGRFAVEGGIGFESFPQESAARLMNPIGLNARRFRFAPVRGGQEFTDMIEENYQRDRREQGWGDTKIRVIGNRPIGQFEYSGMVGVGGVFSAWRQEKIIMETAPSPDVNRTLATYLREEKKNVEEILHVDKESIEQELSGRFTGRSLEQEAKKIRTSRLKGNLSGRLAQVGEIKRAEGESDEKWAERQAERQRIITRARQRAGEGDTSVEAFLLETMYLKEDGDLKEFNNALGVLLKHGDVTPREIESPKLKETKEKVRRELWKKTAQENPLAVVPYLYGMKFDGKPPAGFEDISKDDFKESEDPEKPSTWDRLKTKLIAANEKRLERIMMKQLIRDTQARARQEKRELTQEEIDQFNEEVSAPVPDLDSVLRELFGEKSMSQKEEGESSEEELLKKIRTSGKAVAGELANVRFPFNPFMNDVIFERAHYGAAGADFYKRRIGRDQVPFNQGVSEIAKLINNPGGIKEEEALGIMHGAVEALGTPQGTEIGQDKVMPVFEAYLRWVENGGYIRGSFEGLRRWWAKGVIVEGIAHTFRLRTSLAQKYAGMDAPSLEENGLRNLAENALRMGILRRGKKEWEGEWEGEWVDLFDKVKKKFRLSWFQTLWRTLLRDLMPIFAVAATVDVVKKGSQEVTK